MSISSRIRSLLDLKSTRGVSFATTAIAMLSKPAGYVRMLVIAWLFGTSAGMDAYHLAFGIVNLFAASIGGALQNSLVPEIQRLRDQDGGAARAQALFALASCVVFVLCALMCAAFAIAPGLIVKSFAGGFDTERVQMGAVMMLWLTPLGAATMLRPLLDIWAVFTERYTLGALSSITFNIAAIPAIIIAAPIVGVYSVAAGTSAGFVISVLIFFAALRGIPVRPSLDLISGASVKHVLRDTSLTFVLYSLGALYMIIDRYFASLLPVGAVSAISYSGSIINILTACAATPSLFFLSRISEAVSRDLPSARRTTSEAMALIAAYFIPFSFFLALCARPVISIIYGWGSFDESSIEMTSTTLSAYCFGSIFAIMSTFMGAYAAASQQLRKIVLLSVIGIAVNTSLNWILVRRFGLVGLAAATSLSQAFGWCITFKYLIRTSLSSFIIESRSILLALSAAAAAALSYAASPLGSIAQITISSALCIAHLFAAERAGLMPMVPEHWRPRALARWCLRRH